MGSAGGHPPRWWATDGSDLDAAAAVRPDVDASWGAGHLDGEVSGVEDGLGVFVGVATGARPDPGGEALDDAGHRVRREWPLPEAWRSLPRPALVVGAVLVVGVAALLAGAVGGGGPAADPALPVASVATPTGGDPPDGSGGWGDGLPTAAPPGGGEVASGADETGSGGGGMADGDVVASVVVHVAGAVRQPGVHRLPSGARVHEAIDAAGGPLPGADLDRLNLAAPLTDGSQVLVPLPGDPFLPGSTGSPVGGGGSGPSGTGPVSLNGADAAALDALPGIGPSTAAAIIAHRERNGPFSSVEDLLEVRGIGDAKLEGLRDLVVP